ncbi:DUF6525 family protein [Sulfitobacter sp. S190]|uniref:DUF6525 family protein n=1 Tax=Sulfitobacter sp. S190 TaxID=2867022 RepID=UPI0021A4FDB6|nr:DUF6525 family protein [Sulfitobacter sp. S190]UWR21282.1 hypothetical protein K3756_11215 [Sulfitobacter sp. S190]
MSTNRPYASNLGQCDLRRKRRNSHPMDTYDGLPQPVRQWVAQAALPWSPNSVRRIWSKSRAKGLSHDEALHTLTQAEARTLARDRQSTAFKLNSPT